MIKSKTGNDETGARVAGRTCCLYLRVSTSGQTCDNQEAQLREIAERNGWDIVGAYTDHGISGAKGRDGRPAFDRLLKDAASRVRPFDVILVWSVDRLGRSLQDLVGFLSDIHASGIDIAIAQQSVDTTTAGGKALFQMLGVFAEFERSLIRDRVVAGLDRARAKGVRLGRRAVPPVYTQAIDELLRLPPEERPSQRAIAARVRYRDPVTGDLRQVSRSVVERRARELGVATQSCQLDPAQAKEIN